MRNSAFFLAALLGLASGSLSAAEVCNPDNNAFKLQTASDKSGANRAVTALRECAPEASTWPADAKKWFGFAKEHCEALLAKLSKLGEKGNWAACIDDLAKFTSVLKLRKSEMPANPPAKASPAVSEAPAKKDAIDQILDLAQQKLTNKDPAKAGLRLQLGNKLKKAKEACQVKTAPACKPSLAELAPLIKQI